ncbi:MAG: heavy-metal-associated domain-containing protein [Actinomycetota bacterium]
MTFEFRIPDATCGHCKQTIEATVSAIEGVGGASLNLESKTLKVDHDGTVTTDSLVGAVAAAGYTPEALA